MQLGKEQVCCPTLEGAWAVSRLQQLSALTQHSFFPSNIFFLPLGSGSLHQRLWCVETRILLTSRKWLQYNGGEKEGGSEHVGINPRRKVENTPSSSTCCHQRAPRPARWVSPGSSTKWKYNSFVSQSVITGLSQFNIIKSVFKTHNPIR